MNALFSPGSIEISSFTTATQAFDAAQSFSYFLFPMKEISVPFATSNCSGAVIFVVIAPTIVPLRTALISSIVICFISWLIGLVLPNI